MQLTFGDGEYDGKRTRREVFLAEMDQVVPWKDLLALIRPHYPKSGQPGRQPYPLETMLRIHFLQQWYALSDPAMEEALYEIARCVSSHVCRCWRRYRMRPRSSISGICWNVMTHRFLLRSWG